jgi:uncharacterized membrane protein
MKKEAEGLYFAIFVLACMIAALTYKQGELFIWVILRSVVIALPITVIGGFIADAYEKLSEKNKALKYACLVLIVLSAIYAGYHLIRW